jgi:hypothetical protein
MTEDAKAFRERRPAPPAPRAGRETTAPPPPPAGAQPAQPDEIGGPTGPEPTRYGDWERGGRCTDF